MPAYLIRRCHEKGIKVYAMFINGRVPQDAPWYREGWRVVDAEGNSDEKDHCDYTNPEVKAFQVAMMRDFVELYPDVDGLQFDYIRFSWRKEQPFTKYAREAFRKETGVDPLDLVKKRESFSPEEHRRWSGAWRRWRMERITEVVREVGRAVRAIHPEIRVCASVLAPESWWTTACQDWPRWINEGLIDFVKPMYYHWDPDKYESMVDSYRALANAEDRWLRIIPSLAGGVRRDWPDEFRDDAERGTKGVLDVARLLRRKGLHGFNFFNLRSLSEETVKELRSGLFSKPAPVYHPPLARP